jgi:hypothetical protein
MYVLQTNRRHADIIAKQVLRAHVDQLPPAKKREFIAVAFELIAKRTRMSEAEMRARYGPLVHSVKQ